MSFLTNITRLRIERFHNFSRSASEELKKMPPSLQLSSSASSFFPSQKQKGKKGVSLCVCSRWSAIILSVNTRWKALYALTVGRPAREQPEWSGGKLEYGGFITWHRGTGGTAGQGNDDLIFLQRPSLSGLSLSHSLSHSLSLCHTHTHAHVHRLPISIGLAAIIPPHRDLIVNFSLDS